LPHSPQKRSFLLTNEPQFEQFIINTPNFLIYLKFTIFYKYENIA
jgi:hypothetical protein